MRDKLIELIMSSGCVSGFAGSLADHLIAHGVTIQRWIPVSEPPKPFESVLVQMPDEEPCPTVREGYFTNNGTWYAGYFEREPSEVTHWMPMPEFHSKEKQNVS